MDLNNILSKCDIDPKQVLVLRHRPSEPRLNKVLPWLVVEELVLPLAVAPAVLQQQRLVLLPLWSLRSRSLQPMTVQF